jgi:hypothetical protein
MNMSPSTSVTEPTASNRKPKRSKSMKSIEDMTQLTTPGISRDATEKDPWEFPGSSVSSLPRNAGTKVISRNAIKTYGKTIQRSKTTDMDSSLLQDQASPRQFPIGEMQPTDSMVKEARSNNLKRPLLSQEADELSPTLPKPKRPKSSATVNGGLVASSKVDRSFESLNLKSTGTTIQVPRSTSEEARQLSMRSLNGSSVLALNTQLMVEHLTVDTIL